MGGGHGPRHRAVVASRSEAERHTATHGERRTATETDELHHVEIDGWEASEVGERERSIRDGSVQVLSSGSNGALLLATDASSHGSSYVPGEARILIGEAGEQRPRL